MGVMMVIIVNSSGLPDYRNCGPSGLRDHRDRGIIGNAGSLKCEFVLMEESKSKDPSKE
jgi:hypothetical protein